MAQHTVVVEQAPTQEKKKRKKLPFILGGIGVLAIVPLVGSTFAASITLNDSGSIEFGQGVVNAAACDNTIDVALASDVVNVSGTPTFALGSLKLNNIDLGASACAGKTITIRLAKSDGTLLEVGTGGTDTSFAIAISSDGTTATVTAGTQGIQQAAAVDGSTITVTPGTGDDVLFHNSTVKVNSADVSGVLLESTN
ncbi:MAG: hypothetical protein RLZZ600_942 [Actinomycetota bacterium]|jgi:hypothetical protein